MVVKALTAEALWRSRKAGRALTAEDCSRRWCASEVTGWLFSGQFGGGCRVTLASTPSPIEIEWVDSRRRMADAERGSWGEGREMW